LNKKHATLGFERDSPKSEDEKFHQKRDEPLETPPQGRVQVVPLNGAYATINGQKQLIDECVYMFWIL